MLDLRVGAALNNDRVAIDDRFDVGIYVRFESRRALTGCLTDPVRLRTVKQVFEPLCARIRVHELYAP